MRYSIATDKDQSNRLTLCGVSGNTADMTWRKIFDPASDSYEEEERLCLMRYETAKIIYGEKAVTPAWSLSMLLALLPATITQGKKVYYLDFAPYDDKGWGIGYFDSVGKYFKGLAYAYDPIEAVVRLIEWLNRDGYSLNLINDKDNGKENQNGARD